MRDVSLTRNPNMPYISAGQQSAPYERMRVRSNVYVPDAEAGSDNYDGRPAYQAPQTIGRIPITISLRAALIVVAATVMTFAVLCLSAAAKRASLVRQGRLICEEIRVLEMNGEVLDLRLSNAKEETSICYTAARDLQMIDGVYAAREAVYAPSTRPGNTEKEMASQVHEVTLGIRR